MMVVIRSKADVENPPSSASSVGNGLDNTGNAIALLKLLSKTVGLLLDLGLDHLLLVPDSLLKLLDFCLESSQLADVVFQG